VKAGTSGAFIADHERIALAGCAPYFHVLYGTMELQGHCQSVWGHSIKRLSASSAMHHRASPLRKRPGQNLPSQSQKCHPAVALPKFNIMAARQICRLPLRVVFIHTRKIYGRQNVPVLHPVSAIKRHGRSPYGPPSSQRKPAATGSRPLCAPGM
jgi:hypothetical protein